MPRLRDTLQAASRQRGQQTGNEGYGQGWEEPGAGDDRDFTQERESRIRQEQVPPDPGHKYFTNVRGTLGKWLEGGVPKEDIRFIAETPEDMEAARSVGVEVERSDSYVEPPVRRSTPTQPTTEEMEGVKHLKGAWGNVVNEVFEGDDPLLKNPIEEGIRVREGLEKRFSTYLTDPTSSIYTKYSKLIDSKVAEVEKNIEKAQERAFKMRGELKELVMQRLREKAAVELKGTPSAPEPANVRQATNFMQGVLKSLASYNFTEAQLESLREDNSDANVIRVMSQAEVKPELVDAINVELQAAGMGKMTQATRTQFLQTWWEGLRGKPGTKESTTVTRTFGKRAGGVQSQAAPQAAPQAQPQRQVVKQFYSPSTGKTKYVYSDGTEEVR